MDMLIAFMKARLMEPTTKTALAALFTAALGGAVGLAFHAVDLKTYEEGLGAAFTVAMTAVLTPEKQTATTDVKVEK